jgi:hypothetical protein
MDPILIPDKEKIKEKKEKNGFVGTDSHKRWGVKGYRCRDCDHFQPLRCKAKVLI